MTTTREMIAAERVEQQPHAMTVDEHLAMIGDLPDADTCPYCAEGLQEVRTAIEWQRITVDRDANGDLDITDWGSSDSEGDGREYHIECRGASHQFDDLGDLDRQQRDQHALRLVVMSDPYHAWNAAGDEPGVSARLRAIYTAAMFAGSRARLARIERRSCWSYTSSYLQREKFRVTFETPRPAVPPVELADVIGVAA